mmetsp:Transcript_106344/g.295893  ORF Transcript_106344/g.295893 Transcript_106344/m.295893 type:complete len:218 (+) Transcript_106344:80-733(+)
MNKFAGASAQAERPPYLSQEHLNVTDLQADRVLRWAVVAQRGSGAWVTVPVRPEVRRMPLVVAAGQAHADAPGRPVPSAAQDLDILVHVALRNVRGVLATSPAVSLVLLLGAAVAAVANCPLAGPAVDEHRQAEAAAHAARQQEDDEGRLHAHVSGHHRRRKRLLHEGNRVRGSGQVGKASDLAGVLSNIAPDAEAFSGPVTTARIKPSACRLPAHR